MGVLYGNVSRLPLTMKSKEGPEAVRPEPPWLEKLLLYSLELQNCLLQPVSRH